MGRPQPESQLHTTGVAITHPAETGFLKVSPASFGFACLVNLSHSLTSPSAPVTASHPGGQKCHFREGSGVSVSPPRSAGFRAHACLCGWTRPLCRDPGSRGQTRGRPRDNREP